MLTADDTPCLCGETPVDASDLAGECACRSDGFSCFDPSACDSLEVADASTVWDALPGYGSAGPYITGAQPITVDLIATVDLVLDATDLCHLGQGCEPVRFTGGRSVDGVTLEGPDDYYAYPGFLYRYVHVTAGTRFRLRPYYMDIHPMPPNFAKVIETTVPCTQICNAGQARCREDQLCYSAGRSYCYGCTNRGVEVCECLDADGPEPDGTPCDFFISGDVVVSGECRAGVCEADMW